MDNINAMMRLKIYSIGGTLYKYTNMVHDLNNLRGRLGKHNYINFITFQKIILRYNCISF